MSDGTKIEWSQHPETGKGASWNPVLARRLDTGKVGYHCEHVSPGCEHCYSEVFNGRQLPNRGTGLPFKPGHRKDVEIFVDEKQLVLPLSWREPRGIFVCSMSDLFGTFVTDEQIDRVFAIMALAPQHVFMVLTKRPERMRAYLEGCDGSREWVGPNFLTSWHRRDSVRKAIDDIADQTGRWQLLGKIKQLPLPNVWVGTSVEDQPRADERIPLLLSTPAAVHFISAEPLLGPVDLVRSCSIFQGGGEGADEAARGLDLLHWVIVGGESGPHSRDFRLSWARSLVAQTKAAGVACFMKQMGSSPIDDLGYQDIAHPARWSTGKGGDIAEWPRDLRVRQFPGVVAI